MDGKFFGNNEKVAKWKWSLVALVIPSRTSRPSYISTNDSWSVRCSSGENGVSLHMDQMFDVRVHSVLNGNELTASDGYVFREIETCQLHTSSQ